LDTRSRYFQGNGSGIENQWLEALLRYFPTTEPGGDNQWHEYLYDQEFDVDTTDSGLAGRVVSDYELDGYAGSSLARTDYGYINDTDLDVNTKVYDHFSNNLLDTLAMYYQGDGSGIENQWLKNFKKYFPTTEPGGDNNWHNYTYDTEFDVDTTDDSLVGRITKDVVLTGYDGTVVTETDFTYFNFTDLDVVEKAYDHKTDDLLDTVSTYYIGDGSGIQNQWLETLITYFPSTEPDGDDKWHRYTYDQSVDVDTTDEGLAGRVIKDEVYVGAALGAVQMVVVISKFSVTTGDY